MEVKELNEVISQIKQREETLNWEGTFADYLSMAVEKPELARLSHARIYDAILDGGIGKDRLGQTLYNLFADDLFGIEKSIAQVVEYFGSAGRRMATRNRILLLLGPPASGKTTLANLLKQGLEKYTRTARGAFYAIKDCPMQEEPLHLIPPDFRAEFEKKYGLYIEGDLCPHCRWMLTNVYHGNIDQVKVRRSYLSEQMGVGIGTFVATEPGSQELTRLTGSVDPEATGDDRIQTYGKAFRLNGELNAANRGLMEFIEIFKLDERFLAVLLVLTEEHKIKAPGFGTFYADEAILAHSNESEYESLVSNKKTEALQDRIVVVRVPYNLRVNEETRIYEKLLKEVNLKDTQIAPLCLPVASIFAVLSRLLPSEKYRISPIKKMHLYDGKYVEGFSYKDVVEMQEEFPREGMIGVSPRFVINQIARAISRPGIECLEPIDLLQVIWDGVEQSTTLSREEHQRLFNLFQETRREYDAMALSEVKKAFVQDFDQQAGGLIHEYVEAIRASLKDTQGQESRIGFQKSPYDKLMRSLEQEVGIQDNESGAFRREIAHRVDTLEQAGLTYDYSLDPRLEEAVIRRLCPNFRTFAAVLEPRNRLSAEQLAKRDEVQKRLVKERGYTKDCAEHLIDYAATLINERERPKLTLPKSMRWLREG
jgi:serine protein kinase